MLPNFLATALALATVTSASPITRSSSTNAWDLDWISTDSSLPKVIIYSAGGTILSASNYSRLDNIAYGAGASPTPYDLIGNVSEALKVAQLAVVELDAPGGSAGLNSSLYLNISQLANAQICAEGSDVAGAIMFHGTNTLEETAFGVDLTFNCSKPFVATGSMRPDTYVSPDGHANFYQAVAAAASPSSRDRGGLIAFNDRPSSKGILGAFLAGQPYYFFDPAYPTGRPYFDVTGVTELPSVIIVYGHQGFDASLMHAAVANGAKGLVILGPGAAAVSPSARAAAADLLEQRGIPTIAVARPVTGTGVPSPFPGPLIYSSYLGGEQARIMLQLAIDAGYDINAIRGLFESPLRRTIYDTPANQKFYYSR
ncbi:L-asparaginase [Colletotrichum abscissum]|uniref:asparaginase n=1 Tax=Colletotrichum abscissum TaxID=1671311 RepID=A0A9P9X824_9PEZI|nr:L-asparaginase [Colletotrichum abscissum]KAI3541386.1 L-asparaginase [Colletotrichum abscissum]KAK1477790.1 L-asparaginase [Colletotrichum abscissum]